MKKFLLQRVLLFLILLAALKGNSQTTFFSENMGTSGATGNPSITAFSSFQNSGCVYSYSGTGNVSTTSPSGGSGSNNVYLSTGGAKTFIISGINTLGYSSIGITYNLNVNSALSSGSGFSVEVSTTGVTYTALTRPGNFWVFAGWLSETPTGSIPATQNLYLRFTNNSGGLDFRIDDLVLSGTPTASTNPASAYNSWPAAYTLSSWPSSSAAGTYPPNMIFHYGAVGAAQPTLSSITPTYNYTNSYSLTAVDPCASLISGQGTGGISFVNRNPGTSASTGNLGEAVLALNTTCRSSVQVSWQAGTVTNNGSPYRLLAQYRVGNTGAYTNLPNSSLAQIQYTSPATTTSFGPIVLPSSCENVALVQIRWVYYYGGSGAGSGDEVSLSNISVASSAYPVLSSVSNQTVCGGKLMSGFTLSTTPAGATFTWTNNNTSIGIAASGNGSVAPYTSPVVSLPPDKVGVITVLSALNSCTSTTVFSITVKGPQPLTNWVGGVSSDWSDHDNWSNCVCGSVSTVTIPAVSNPSFNPVFTGTVSGNVGNLTLNTSSSLSVQSTQTLNVAGNWTNNGLFNAQKGTVVLNGSSAQSLGGSINTPFYNLTLSNSTGASLSSAQQITGSLQLNAGTFNTNNLLTLAAGSSGSGRIGPITAAADIINQVTVQQYAPGGSTGWTLLGSPISSALTMASWNDNFIITCLSCPNGSLGGFTSIYSYNETIAGSYSISTKYIPISSLSDNLSNGKGYWVYLGNGNPTTTAINFDVSGTVAKSSCLSCGSAINIPLTKTNNTSTFDDGWNLVANPLPSPISWTALRNSNANVDNAIYVYNPDLNSGQGAFATFINNVSSVVVGGITDTIPMCQGFYVHATASTSLIASESVKLSGNPVFLRTASVSPQPILRLLMDGPSQMNDMATFYFHPGGNLHFQADDDAYKLVYDASFPYIGSMSDSLLTAINGLPDQFSSLSIPVKAITAQTDSFYFSLLSSDFPDHVCVRLYDAYTQLSTDLLTSGYHCLLHDSTTAARFTLNIFSSPLSASSHLHPPDCSNPLSGTINAVGNTTGPWDYEWKSGSLVVKISLHKNSADSLVTGGSGNYSVKINTSGQCDHFSQAFNIPAITLPLASFALSTNTAYLSSSDQIHCFSSSGNAQTYDWDFGDGIGSSQLSDPVYNYGAPGNYQVSLRVQSSSGCLDSSFSRVTVISDITALDPLSLEGSVRLLSMSPAGTYQLVLQLSAPEELRLSLYDLGGQLLRLSQIGEVKEKTIPIQLDEFPGGIYFLKLDTPTRKKTFRLVK